MYVYVYIFVKVLVVFYGEEEFEALAVSSNVTAEEVVNDNDIQIQLDKTGINNRFDNSSTSLYLLTTLKNTFEKTLLKI